MAAASTNWPIFLTPDNIDHLITLRNQICLKVIDVIDVIALSTFGALAQAGVLLFSIARVAAPVSTSYKTSGSARRCITPCCLPGVEVTLVDV